MTRQLDLSTSIAAYNGDGSTLNTSKNRMKISYAKFYFSMIAMLVSGAINTIVLKIERLVLFFTALLNAGLLLKRRELILAVPSLVD